ncbi:hypothetical protein HPB48_019912 [Haemaphysalis longicornis]|uniref:Uncharacterized protein n=1 Tax=Haemaphysalis longicornis TaxID=44386 RepID=A0A9J6FVS2_HAELO|nr:hypothetical protein HPB48_019912 [Haemaphysalis longicornis]
MDQGVIKNLKLHYQSRLVNRVLLCVDSDESYVVDVLSDVSIVSDAWRTVTQTRSATASGMRDLQLEFDDDEIILQAFEQVQVDSDYDDGEPPMLEASNIDLGRALA